MKKHIISLLVVSILSFFLFEIGLALLSNLSILKMGAPSYAVSNITSRFWIDANKDYGPWHEPGSNYIHAKSCFKWEYTANKFGARDKERIVETDRNRTVVLGDSFIEGFGVDTQNRLTDVLEASTGREFLNFGTSGSFGTIQESILYDTFASKFSHDTVLIALLPANDFLDDDLHFGKNFYGDRYRPYYQGEYPNYKIIYYPPELKEKPDKNVAQIIKGLFREFTYSYHLASFLKGIYYSSKKVKTRKKPYSGYFDFHEESINRLQFSYEKIIRKAKEEGREVYVVSLPVYTDILRYSEEGKAPLTERLEELSKQVGFKFIDLLPYMHDFTSDWQDYYLECDDHWGDQGNKVAADFLKSVLFQDKK